MNNGKKNGRGRLVAPGPHLECSSHELLAQSGSTFEKAPSSMKFRTDPRRSLKV
jgi:hypothetical protein